MVKQAYPARSPCLVVCRGSEQLTVPPGTQALRPSFALGRWQKAVSMAMIVSKVGNSGGLHQYMSGGKSKQGMIKVRNCTPDRAFPSGWLVRRACLSLHIPSGMPMSCTLCTSCVPGRFFGNAQTPDTSMATPTFPC